MSNIARIPFSELYERVKLELVRDRSTNVTITETKFRGVVNDTYEDFIGLLDEDYLRKTGYFTTIAPYSPSGGQVAISQGGSIITAVAGTGVVFTAAMNDALFRSNSTNTVYRVNYLSATQLTLIQPSTWIEASITNDGFSMRFNRYALATDFSHMVMDDVDRPEAVYAWLANSGASRFFLRPKDWGLYEKEFNYTSAQASGFPGQYAVGYVNAAPYLHIWPMDSLSRALFYQYIPSMSPLREYTVGTGSLANGATSVTGAGTTWTSMLNSTDEFYIRFDDDGVGADSYWYRISNTGFTDTSLTITGGYIGASKTNKNYTISNSSKYPHRFDRALIYGAALKIDPNAQDSTRWASLFTSITGTQKMIDGTRRFSQKIESPSKGYMNMDPRS